jgi:NhaP-type Na+/H+ and K+/H+ antiporter
MTNKTFLKKRAFVNNISKEQAKDAGMAVVLILLLLGIFLKQKTFYPYAAAALVVNMILPGIYKPFAVIWYGLATFLGTIMSKVLLTVVYILLVVPVGLIRRLSGKDSLQLKKFKKDGSSVFRERDHLFQSTDIENPY